MINNEISVICLPLMPLPPQLSFPYVVTFAVLRIKILLNVAVVIKTLWLGTALLAKENTDSNWALRHDTWKSDQKSDLCCFQKVTSLAKLLSLRDLKFSNSCRKTFVRSTCNSIFIFFFTWIPFNARAAHRSYSPKRHLWVRLSHRFHFLHCRRLK